MHSRHWLVCLVLLLVAAPFVRAHDGVPEQILAISGEIAVEPRRADLYLRRAELRRQVSQFDAARADLQRASMLDQALLGVDLVLARLERDQQHPSAAAAAATRHLAHDADHNEALLIRGRATAQIGKRRDGAADLTRALARQPNPDVYLERAAMMSVDPADLEEALGGLDEGIRRLGHLVTLELAAIDLERRLQHYDSALARVDRMAASTPRNEQWLARRGSLLEDAHRPSEALAAYRAALASIDTLPPARRSSGSTAALVTDLTTCITRLTATPAPRRPGRSLSR